MCKCYKIDQAYNHHDIKVSRQQAFRQVAEGFEYYLDEREEAYASMRCGCEHCMEQLLNSRYILQDFRNLAIRVRFPDGLPVR